MDSASGDYSMEQAILITFAARSDVGLRRSENQDNYGIFPKDPIEPPGSMGRLFIIADGMGGHSGGREASEMAVRLVEETYFSDTANDTANALRHALEHANEQIYQRAEASPHVGGMGTTCTALVLKGRTAYLAHVGDSRAYRINRENVWQLTRDHSKVAELQRQGILSEKEAREHPERSIIMRALGIAPAVEVDIIEDIPINAGECFLLCTDGLAAVKEREMSKVVLSNPPEVACQKLIASALDRGGQDNVTVQVIRIDGALQSDATPQGSRRNTIWQKIFHISQTF